jgi:KDO2-lipid IV(A) lauroyltransferase
MWLLLFHSWGLYIWVYYLIGYRKKVVRTNLANSFPQKNKSELKSIESKYYLHLCDLVVENIWTQRASERQLQKRCPIEDIEIFTKLFNEKKDFVCLLGHVGNWEWCNLSFNTYHLHHLKALYRPLKNKPFDDFFIRYRSRFGAKPIPMQQLAREINEVNSTPTVFAFIADQSPVPEYAYWTQFLHQDTCFFNGYDKIARKKNYPVLLAYLIKTGRARYKMKVELLSENAAQLSEDAITELYARRLETIIEEHPEHWLWSHRRWKHGRN